MLATLFGSIFWYVWMCVSVSFPNVVRVWALYLLFSTLISRRIFVFRNIWDQTRNWAVTILHFVQCSGGKSSDSQEQESLAIQLLFLSAYNRIPGVMIDLFDNLVSICQFLCLIYFFLMNLYGVPAPSYEKLYKSGQIFTSVGIIKWTFNGIDLNKKVNHRLACDLHAPIQTLHHRWHQESLFYLDL